MEHGAVVTVCAAHTRAGKRGGGELFLPPPASSQFSDTGQPGGVEVSPRERVPQTHRSRKDQVVWPRQFPGKKLLAEAGFHLQKEAEASLTLIPTLTFCCSCSLQLL